ncbi:MAG: outer membrane lipoprotein LolB [Betaproteobacteria bacterium]|nr:outer membrane lipoprotein LolB [Betaproteobacteria bacterium]
MPRPIRRRIGARVLFSWLAAALPLLLAACASVGPREEAPLRPPRESIRAFVLEGRVALRDATRSLNANVSWGHLGASDEILLTTPLGQGVASLVGDAGGARLETADGRRYTAADVEGLSQELFGARLPLRDMPSWVVGQASAVGRMTSDTLGRPARLQEQGWTIDYLDYEHARPDALPVLLELRRGDLHLRLKVDAWSLAQ